MTRLLGEARACLHRNAGSRPMMQKVGFGVRCDTHWYGNSYKLLQLRIEGARKRAARRGCCVTIVPCQSALAPGAGKGKCHKIVGMLKVGQAAPS